METLEQEVRRLRTENAELRAFVATAVEAIGRLELDITEGPFRAPEEEET